VLTADLRFRISLLSGWRYFLSSIIGIRRARARLFRRLEDFALPTFIEIWSGLPELFSAHYPRLLVTPNFWWLLGHPAALHLDVLTLSVPPNSCARAILTM